MLYRASAPVQALLGTLFTWLLTAVGAAGVYVSVPTQRHLDAALGFAAGVMLAASFWSLLAPAIEMSEDWGGWAFIPAGLGFALGAAFVHLSEVVMLRLGFSGSVADSLLHDTTAQQARAKDDLFSEDPQLPEPSARVVGNSIYVGSSHGNPFNTGPQSRRRRGQLASADTESNMSESYDPYQDETMARAAALQEAEKRRRDSWRRTMLLVLAVTVHNIPEGMAVGVGFASAKAQATDGDKTKGHSAFLKACNLAVGIGLQNFPEGLAVSVPLHRAGFSKLKAFWYGQLSGMVEPLAGVLAALAAQTMSAVLPYALGFAAGAMVYVVVDDILPETSAGPNGKMASWGAIVGFLLMMSLDVGLG